MTQTSCPRCRDIGIAKLPNGLITVCPELDLAHPHCEINAAGQLVRKAVMRLNAAGIPVNDHDLSVALHLIDFSTDKPCDRDMLINKYFTFSNSATNRLRNFHHTIERLRSAWMLPIGGRKESPSGYWIITDESDFAEWMSSYKSAPLTQLTTAYRVAKHNFPIFAKQLELDFMSELAIQEVNAS